MCIRERGNLIEKTAKSKSFNSDDGGVDIQNCTDQPSRADLLSCWCPEITDCADELQHIIQFRPRILHRREMDFRRVDGALWLWAASAR